MHKGMVFDIQRFCIHDGPGIRTTVFLKGCSLRCFWCHNPESWSTQTEVMFFRNKCIHCGFCAKICENNAHEVVNGTHIFHREKCTACGKCVKGCASKALIATGETATVDQIMNEIKKDISFYTSSKGGVTFSGGEPLLQSEFLASLLKECKALGIHTAIETAGNVDWSSFSRVLPYTDLFLYDIKLIDNEKHQKATGSSNERCRENLKKLHAENKKITVRIPVIPTVNDSEKDMEDIFHFVKKIDQEIEIEKMLFHSMGLAKYESLGREYEAAKLQQ